MSVIQPSSCSCLGLGFSRDLSWQFWCGCTIKAKGPVFPIAEQMLHTSSQGKFTKSDK